MANESFCSEQNALPLTEKQTLAQRLVIELLKQQKYISTAESCTGGGIGQALTSVSGCSAIYGTGVITYSNEAKERLLGVPHEILQSFGAVSPQTAEAMAEGALRLADADIALAVTGIAGPGGGSPAKPVGLVYIGCARRASDTVTEKHLFAGDRQAVREQTICAALRLALKNLGVMTND